MIATPASRTAPLRALPLLRVALAAAPVVALEALKLAGHRVDLPAAWFLPIHAIVEAGITAMALATFAVQWFASGTRDFQEARGRLLGASFLGVGLLELLHLLAYPGMPGVFGTATVERGIFYWFAARAWILIALLVVLFLRPESDSRFLRRRWLVPLTLAVVVGLAALDVALPAGRTWFYEPAIGLTPVKIVVEWALAGLALAGAWLSSRRNRSVPGGGPLGKISLAFVAMGLAEVSLSLYRDPYDLLNMAGHAYLAAGFWFLFDALFVATLLRPHRELEALRAHVEDELVVTIRRLERMREQREDFLRAVSHDLRNPLQVVLLQADRIARAAPDLVALRRPVAAIRFAGRRMERMLRDLTDAAKLEVGELALNREPVALRPFVDHLLEVEQGVLDSSRVHNEIDAALPPLDVDPDRLDRILVNLLGNALKYSDGPVRIAAAVQGPGDAPGDAHGEAERAEITVADQGAGIPPADLARLFERYYRGQRHEGEGLGLGLFIVKGLVEAHGGSIHAASVAGAGSTFTVRLPIVNGAAAQGYLRSNTPG